MNREVIELSIPEKFIDEFIEESLIGLDVEIFNDDGIYTFCSFEMEVGNYDDFIPVEKYLTKKGIPFDFFRVYAESSKLPSIRYVRPEIGFDKTLEVTESKTHYISTEKLYKLLKDYASNKDNSNSTLIKISSLITENDPILTKRIKTLKEYV